MIFLSFSRRIPFQIPRKLQRGSPEVQAFSWFQGPGRLADDPQTSNGGRTNATLQYLFKMIKLVRLRVFVNKARGLMKERFQRLTNWRKPHSCSTSDQLELYCCRSPSSTSLWSDSNPVRMTCSLGWFKLKFVAVFLTLLLFTLVAETRVRARTVERIHRGSTLLLPGRTWSWL